MFARPPVIDRPRPWWPLLGLVLVSSAGLWLLDTHQPLAWPDAAAPWFEHARALSPVTIGLDRLNALGAITPDLPAASALVLLALGVSILATLLVIETPAWLALAVAVGAIGTRSLWSTVTPGSDALPVLLVGVAVWALTGPSPRAWTLAAMAVPLVAPPATWLAAPAFGGRNRRTWRRVGLAAVALAAGLAVQALLTRHARAASVCLDAGAWLPALVDAWRPGLSADGSAWVALRQWASVLVGDVHLFGLTVATFGLAVARTGLASLRRATLLALLISVVTVAAGALPPALAAALLLPWWAPWFAVGLDALVERTGGRQRSVAMVFAVVAAAATPLLRSATVVPGPWVAGTPATARAVTAATRGGLIVTEDAVSTRRLRLEGAATIAADRQDIAACLAQGRRVSLFGATVPLIERAGFTIEDATLRAPLADVLRDVRTDHLVALAMSPSSLPWAGPRGLAMLHRLGVRREHEQATAALGLVARTDRGGHVATGREGTEVALRAGDVVGRHQLLEPVSVSAHANAAQVGSPSRPLASGRHAALAVFDRAQEIELRAAAAASPGLPVPLNTHARWRHAVAAGQPQCVDATTTWTALPGTISRVGLPIAAASRARPVVLYLAADSRPQADVHGLAPQVVLHDWSVDRFDTQRDADATRLREAAQHDVIPLTTLPRGRWVVRVAIGPRSSWHPSHVAVTAGVAASWVVRLPDDGFRASTTRICRMDVAGERLFHGHFTVVDDDSPYELGVWMQAGWHTPELLRGQAHQWTAQPHATVGFRTPTPRPVVLALDASAATTPAGPQRLTVRLNGHVISDDWQGARRVEVPASLLRAGDNTLALEVPSTVQPVGERRALGVLVRQLRLIDPRPR